jgi:glyoxylase-like metal-dependent hydrolase (beta-lactamase superfamily II)
MISAAFGPGLHVMERGWLSSNNVLLDDADGATLIDTGHSVHAEQTVALLRQLLGGKPLRHVVNTHLHSDHCGGNAAVQREWALDVRVPSGSFKAVQDWDEQALSYRPTRQRCERYGAQGSVSPGQVLRIGRRDWQVMAAPGHDPESVILFDAGHGVLISADALWENGFGVVFPELDGEAAFDDVQRVLAWLDAVEGAGGYGILGDGTWRLVERAARGRTIVSRYEVSGWYGSWTMNVSSA